MEPDIETADALRTVLQQLKDLEPIFHRSPPGMSRSDWEAMTAADFWEVGASGRRYSRDYVIDTLLARTAGPQEITWRTENFLCQQLAPDHYLLTYTLHQGPRITRRATIWCRSEQGWVAVYHQGTIVEVD